MKFNHRYVVLALVLAAMLLAGSVAAALVCSLSVTNQPNNQIRINASASGDDLASVQLVFYVYANEAACIADNPESTETLADLTWAPGATTEYSNGFTRTVPTGKWYKVSLVVTSHTDDICEKEISCSTWSSPVPTTSTVGIVLLVLLLAVAGGMLIKRARLA